MSPSRCVTKEASPQPRREQPAPSRPGERSADRPAPASQRPQSRGRDRDPNVLHTGGGRGPSCPPSNPGTSFPHITTATRKDTLSERRGNRPTDRRLPPGSRDQRLLKGYVAPLTAPAAEQGILGPGHVIAVVLGDDNCPSRAEQGTDPVKGRFGSVGSGRRGGRTHAAGGGPQQTQEHIPEEEEEEEEEG
ncbi:hypothetical protein AAFF_G00196670 [Aldrovandia affinis]|uniref:Uncharacterized protein n=1 Tax=Aldrovandia affinis TaxID=143900 RepID=A0AAD7W5G5_9TELE|nr:hypothetical protein AAFF_G00196670 [Aldrovandia affinis]